MPSARLAEFRKMPHISGVPYSVVLFIVFLLKKLDACTLLQRQECAEKSCDNRVEQAG